MYLGHFGLREFPFANTPDTSFFFAHDSYQEALNTLLLCAHGGEGFIKVIGEVGTGKTLLCRKFLAALKGGFVSAYIPNPYMQPMTLLLAVADELGIRYPPGVNQHQLLKLLTRGLVDAYAARRRVVLCLDEAQAMPVETLEALRLLSNLETERRKLLQVVLFGQPELDRRLKDPAIRQLRQRIAFACRLRPLRRADVDDYLRHRLAVAGYRGGRLFTRAAARRLAAASGGTPRLLNILAHKSLMAAFGRGEAQVCRRHVLAAARDTESVRPALRLRAGWWRLTGGVLAALLAATWYWER